MSSVGRASARLFFVPELFLVPELLGIVLRFHFTLLSPERNLPLMHEGHSLKAHSGAHHNHSIEENACN
jgi:hypothetical protein